jgi:hypothetical protein
MSEREYVELSFDIPPNNSTMPLVEYATIIVNYYPETDIAQHRLEVVAFYFNNEALTDVPPFSRAEFLSRIYDTLLETCEYRCNPESYDDEDDIEDDDIEDDYNEDCDGLGTTKDVDDTGYDLDNLPIDDDDLF